MIIAPASTDRTILVFARDIISGLGKTGLVAASINASYTRAETDNDVTIAQITETNLTALTDAHSDGGWYPVDATNAPGLYRFDLPDAVCAAGAWEAVVTIIDAGVNNFEIAPTRIELKTISSLVATDIVSAGAITTLSGAVVNVDLVDLTTTTTTATNLTTNNDKTGYALSATGSAAMTEGYAADGATGTLNQLLYMILQSIHEFAISGTTRTVKKLDGTTDAMTFTLDSATAPTSTTRAT